MEKYQSKIDYSKAENWLDVPAALVKDGVLVGSAAERSRPYRRVYEEITTIPSESFVL